MSPPCVALTHLQRRYRHCSENCRRCVGERRCNRVAVTTGDSRPPLLLARRSPADRIATFAMYKRTISARSGGRKPAVATGAALAKAPPQMFGRLAPACWRTPLQSRSRTTGGSRPPLLFARRSAARGIATFTMHKRIISARSGGCKPAVADGQRTCKGGSALARQTAAGVLTNAVAMALPQARGVYVPRSCS